jgi:hypothetical protein
MSYPTSTLQNIISNFVPSWDMPKQGDLVRCFSPYYFEDNEILIGNRNFLSYNKTSVPYVEVDGKIYYADSTEAIPNGGTGELSSCRKYILVSPWETKGNVGEKLVYSFD